MTFYRDDEGAKICTECNRAECEHDLTTEIFRRSDLEMATCPHRFRNEDRRLQSDISRRGSLNHAIIADYVRHLVLTDQESDPPHALALRDKHLAGVPLDPELRDEVYAGIAKFADTWTLDTAAYHAHEERIILPDIRLTVKPDLLYARTFDDMSEMEITDWKSHPGGFYGEVLDQFQVRCYIVAVANRWPGMSRYRFTFRAVSIPVTATDFVEPAQIEIWKQEIADRVAVIESCTSADEWPVAPGKVCTYCLSQCPIVPLALAQPDDAPLRIQDADHAIREADVVVALERSVKRRQDALRGWCKKNGAVVHSSGALVTGYRPRETSSMKLNDLLSITSESDTLPPNVDIAASKLKPILEAEGETAEKLRAAVATKTGQRFATWKATAETE